MHTRLVRHREIIHVCYGLTRIPLKAVEILTPVPGNVSLFGNRVFASDQDGVIKVDKKENLALQKKKIWTKRQI